jgi:hypothetical protein
LYALHLTDKGATAMTEIGRVARAHDDAICGVLSPAEREHLHELLVRLAESQKLTAGVHPGFARLGEKKPSTSNKRSRMAARPRG